ncbi:hypothetical protein TTHERM_000486238 (macronuclear) [Tetrahymena thermophila SB210]|uniref:Uncharacterized protein n=1 Tax=Tetrahymena thermophila (strain SB210) TaxID=312017 RepID=W7X979_TETTS|nr:hypothetical protein TTHERM_000486238 [Tetrahymena thermophila SB210]EWS72943.1 hypothetical protein TTHERM_000486238 [Tetrahymena thermophila SB210]|eukprot:XP_012654510.1 hypothetical protein TTHERM_000486238 [Tetrahymena thermophila SB210]
MFCQIETLNSFNQDSQDSKIKNLSLKKVTNPRNILKLKGKEPIIYHLKHLFHFLQELILSKKINLQLPFKEAKMLKNKKKSVSEFLFLHFKKKWKKKRHT